MTNLDFAKEWPFTVTEQTMTDGWTWYRVEGVQEMNLTQLEEVYNTPRGGFELVTVDEGEEADSYPESFVNMLEEVTSNGRAIGLFTEPKPAPRYKHTYVLDFYGIRDEPVTEEQAQDVAIAIKQILSIAEYDVDLDHSEFKKI